MIQKEKCRSSGRNAGSRNKITSAPARVRPPPSSPPSVRAPAAPPGIDTARVEVAPGTDNATRDGTLSPGQTDRWVLRARAGQTFAVTIDSADNNTAFSVFDPSWRLLTNVTATQAEAKKKQSA